MRPNVMQTVMPDWNGKESVMGYCIRKRDQREAQIARMTRMRDIITVASLVFLPVVMILGVALGEFIAPYL